MAVTEDRGRDWTDAATSQGTPGVASSHQEVGGRHGTDSLCREVF